MDRRNNERFLTRLRVGSLAVALGAVLAITPFRPLRVAGHSMEPTLQDGNTYLLDLLYWKSGGLRRTDIVVVKHREEKWVKRLIGMPGDELRICTRFDGWITNVYNLTLNPALRQRRQPANEFLEDRTVPPDEIFVIGDNLNWSADSTNQEAGAFKLRDIVGVVRTLSLKREFPFRSSQ